MSKSTRIFGVSAIVLLIVGATFFWALSKNPDTKLAVDIPVPSVTIIPATPTSTSKYTTEFRTKARNAFITNCKLKVGQQYTTACECGADYLAAHYSDSQLEKAYIEYHSGNKIPKEVQTAYDACQNK